MAYKDDDDDGNGIDLDLDLDLEPIKRLTRDLRNASITLGDHEARFLVDAYYQMQDDRKRAYAQERELVGEQAPHEIVTWLASQSETLEGQIRAALDAYTKTHVMGSFMRSVTGIGPVLSAGFLAHIYMGYWCEVCRGHTQEDCAARQKSKKYPEHTYQPTESSPTVGHIWQFAGIAGDMQRVWEKGKKRPYNAKLKTLCWKAGQSFMKLSNNPKCLYGHLYRQRKDYEIARNDGHDPLIVAQAQKGAERVSKTTEAFKHYSTGKLPPAQIDARARRYAVKQFLSDLHGEWFRRAFGREPPLPYPIAILGHAHKR